MSHKPASANAYERLSPSQVIGLFLARLFACLMRLERSGQTVVPSDIANMVTSAEGLVQSFVRMTASAQLESAGFTDIARAMRVPICSREPVVHIEQAQGRCTETSSRHYEQSEGAAGRPRTGSVGEAPASTRKELPQAREPQTPTQLLARLQTSLEQFEQADALASTLARVILCALALMSPELRTRPDYARYAAEALNLPASQTSSTQDPWPPPNSGNPVLSQARLAGTRIRDP